MSGDPVPHYAPPSVPTPMSADAPRRAVVLFMILATAVIFVALFAILYVRWAGSQEPSSVIVVMATPAFEGSEIVVEGLGLPKPYRVKVGSHPGQQFPFYLDRGSYTLRIVRDDQPVYTADFLMQNNQMMRIELSKLEHLLPPPATASAAAAPPTR